MGGARAQTCPPFFTTAMLRRKFGPINAIFSTVGPLFFKNFPLRGSRLGPFRRTACGGANGAKIFENPISTFLGCHPKKAHFPILHCQFSCFYFLACFFSYLFSEFHSKTLARGFFKNQNTRARSSVRKCQKIFQIPRKCYKFLRKCYKFVRKYQKMIQILKKVLENVTNSYETIYSEGQTIFSHSAVQSSRLGNAAQQRQKPVGRRRPRPAARSPDGPARVGPDQTAQSAVQLEKCQKMLEFLRKCQRILQILKKVLENVTNS